jgi:dephospho-CoA kinase
MAGAEPSGTVVALTGGIASGKSTVASMLAELGAHVVDADQLARQVVEPGSSGLAQVAARFGPGVLAKDGSLDRSCLGELVFRDAVARGELEAIIHPLVANLSRELIAAALASGERLVIYEIPLLFETGKEREFPSSLLVYVDLATQLHRLMARSNFSEAAARARLSSQMNLSSKRALATWVVDNGDGRDRTRAQVDQLWRSDLAALGRP